MALMKRDEDHQRVAKPTNVRWSDRDARATEHHFKPTGETRPVIDYERLKELLAIDGLKDRYRDDTTTEAHREFMKKYPSIFARTKPLKGLPVHYERRSVIKGSNTSISATAFAVDKSSKINARPIKLKPVDLMSHDIRDHLADMRHEHRRDKPQTVRQNQIKYLRKLLKKFPFERTALENEQVFDIMKSFSNLATMVEEDLLKELCVVAQLDVWKDEGTTIFGNSGLHIILKGSVRPMVEPFLVRPGHEPIIRCPTPVPDDEICALTVEEAFGTLVKVEGREPNSKVLTVSTSEANCEFMRISCSDYRRVREQIHTRDQTEKMNLLHSCKTFKLWSRQYLMHAAGQVEWTSFPANTVLVSEGFTAPFIAILKSGECHVLRQVDAIHTLANEKTERRTKQVVMGQLGPGDSFGEVSIIANEPIACTIITSSDVVLGVLDHDHVQALDGTTRKLLLQSSERPFAELTAEKIEEEYIRQEAKREWNEFKHSVVVDVINARGIRPGYGKWSK